VILQTLGEANYLIKVNGEQLVEINPETRLPDQTKNLAEDALQATNRLRRLLGNAALREFLVNRRCQNCHSGFFRISANPP